MLHPESDHEPRYVIAWTIGGQLWYGDLASMPRCDPPDSITAEMLERVVAVLQLN